MRIGIGYDSHRLVENRKLIIGGVEVPFERGLAGHSDADVLLHAIGDAILGAMGEGDLGKHFPDTDPAFKNISSMIIIHKIISMAQKRGFRINNVDSTVVIERPQLRKYIDAMNKNIAKALSLDDGCVNVKASTNEKMGFTGREEGVAAFAVVTIENI